MSYKTASRRRNHNRRDDLPGQQLLSFADEPAFSAAGDAATRNVAVATRNVAARRRRPADQLWIFSFLAPTLAEYQEFLHERLAANVVEAIRRQLAERLLSQRRIARAVGVSRGTVDAIAAGRRPDYLARREIRRLERQQNPVGYCESGPPVRCGGCGGLVWLPCVLCRTRAAIRAAAFIGRRRSA